MVKVANDNIKQSVKRSARKKAAEPVALPWKARAAHRWFEGVTDAPRAKGVEKKRESLRKDGPQLSKRRRLALLNKRERIQRRINPLELQRKEIDEALKADWGYVPVEEIESSLGITQFVLSFSYEIEDPNKLLKKLAPSLRREVTRRMIHAKAMLLAADGDEVLRALLGDNIIASADLAIRSPSSRTQKTGQPKEDTAN